MSHVSDSRSRTTNSDDSCGSCSMKLQTSNQITNKGELFGQCRGYLFSSMKRPIPYHRKFEEREDVINSDSENRSNKRQRRNGIAGGKVEPLSILSLVCDQHLAAETNSIEAAEETKQKVTNPEKTKCEPPRKVSPERDADWKNICRPIPMPPRLPTVRAGFVYPLLKQPNPKR